ncbi:MAG: hypothetical protein M3Z35_16160, partial [Nitrospirota bacterium]|nr:hypothetical protein [Nitrospirota bacterium]
RASFSARQKSSTYPGEGASLGWLRAGWVKYRYACGFASPAALLDDLFEHPHPECRIVLQKII